VSIHKRLDALEEQSRRHLPKSSGWARERISENLARAAELRRGGATVENNAELQAMSAAVERRRGEGGR
jgi:hypothetical protein